MSEDFGSYLKHERELRGVPLDNIAESTKIGIRFLRALEEGRFEDLPGEVFIKGFIRSYGQAIGSNVDELLAAYHESSGKGQDKEPSKTRVAPEEEPPERPFVFPTKAVLGFLAALLIIGGGGYWITTKKGENAGEVSRKTQEVSPSTVDNSLPEVDAESPAPGEETAPPQETESPAPESESTEAAKSSETPNQEKPKEAPVEASGPQEPVKNTFTVPENTATIKDIQNQTVPEVTEPTSTDVSEAASGESTLNLVIKVDENSWFNLRVDDQRDQDFILPPGGSKTIQAKAAVVMTIGNRRATQLTLNGQPLDLPESPDNVIRNLTVNAEQLN